MCHKKSKNITSSLPELSSRTVPANIYLFKVVIETLKKVRKLSKVSNKDTKTNSGAFTVNFEHILHLS